MKSHRDRVDGGFLLRTCREDGDSARAMLAEDQGRRRMARPTIDDEHRNN